MYFANKLRSLSRYIKRKILIVVSVFRGRKGYECPLCGKSPKYFVPYGTNELRLNAECPFCRASENDRLEMLWYKKHLDAHDILHFAPEQSQYKYFKSISIEKSINYLTVDIDISAFGVMQKEDICCLSFDDNSFDLIVCNQVLEHIKDDRKAISELARVLKPDGIAVITVPIDLKHVTLEEDWINTDALRIKYYGEAEHERMNGLDFEEKLFESGLSGEKIFAKDFLDEVEIKRAGLEKTGFFFLCRKRG